MVNKPLLLGVTGGIGSGKSVVCHLFAILGVPVYNADDRAKFLIEHDLNVKDLIISTFGKESFVNGVYNRAYISSLIFQSPEKLKQINGIVHPAVAEDFQKWAGNYKKEKYPYLVKEAALLFDSGSATGLDQIAVVHAPDQLRIKRVRQRDSQRSIAEIEDIISRQMPQKEMVKRANLLIDNSEERLLIPQVIEIDRKLRDNLPA